MHWRDLPLKPTIRTLREFAALWCVFFGALAAWHRLVRDNDDLALILALAAVTVGPVGLLFPRVMRPIFVTWLMLAFPVGWMVSRLLLVILFFGVVTPVAFVFRLIGRDALQLKSHPRASDWAPKLLSQDPSSYFRQY